MRPIASLCAALTLAAFAAPAVAGPDEGRVRLAQAPSGPPQSGWATPGLQQAPQAPQAKPGAQSGPPTSDWGSPTPAAPAAAPNAGWSSPTAPGPKGPPQGSWSGGGGGPSRDCMGEITPLLSDAENKGKAIPAAAATKKQPVICQAFRNLATAEGKIVKYFEDYGTECRVPPDALKARKGNLAKIVEVRTKVCDTAAAPAPRAPSLSDALGTSRIPTTPTDTPAATKRGSTFDTLTGNSLNR